MASENRLPAFDRPGLDSHGSLLCTWQVDDNSEGIRAVSVLGVAALEPAPFAQPRTLLVVGNGYSVRGPLGGAEGRHHHHPNPAPGCAPFSRRDPPDPDPGRTESLPLNPFLAPNSERWKSALGLRASLTPGCERLCALPPQTPQAPYRRLDRCDGRPRWGPGPARRLE